MTEEEYIEKYGKTREEMLAETEKEFHAAVKTGDKKRIHELKALFKEVFVGDDVFWANEVGANFFVLVVMIALAAIFVIVTVQGAAGVLDYDTWSLINHVVVCLGQVLIGVILYIVSKGQKAWLKYALMLIVCLTVASAHSIFGYSMEVSLILPVLLSTRYLSEKFTRTVSIASGILLICSSIATVFISISPDLNTVALAAGTQLNIETSLNAAVSAQPYVMGQYLKNQLIYSLMPNMMQLILLYFVCCSIAKWGHRTMLEQAEVAGKFARVDTELNMAKDIQTHILPNIFPAFPDRPELDVYASMTAAREVGGDFYDFFLVDEDHVALVIADVSGKGMPAALFMMIGKTLIKNHAMQRKTPSEVLTAVNRQLCDNNDTGLFITAWVGVLELSTGRLTASNAGHEYPFLKRKDGAWEVLKDRHAFVLGGMDMTRYKDYELQLQPGDRLFVYTDGVTEATSAEVEQFGMERLEHTLNSLHVQSQKELLTGVHEAVNAFVGRAPQFDDLTMLGLSYLGSQQDKT